MLRLKKIFNEREMISSECEMIRCDYKTIYNDCETIYNDHDTVRNDYGTIENIFRRLSKNCFIDYENISKKCITIYNDYDTVRNNYGTIWKYFTNDFQKMFHRLKKDFQRICKQTTWERQCFSSHCQIEKVYVKHHKMLELPRRIAKFPFRLRSPTA